MGKVMVSQGPKWKRWRLKIKRKCKAVEKAIANGVKNVRRPVGKF